MPPRTAGFGNRDHFELNGKIGLDCTGRQDNSASGMLPMAAFHCTSISDEIMIRKPPTDKPLASKNSVHTLQ